MVDTQHFCLRWNNYQSSITSAFENLRDDEDFVDVTLACDGKSLKAHRVVLSACSPYFRELLKSTPCKHPVIVLQDVAWTDLYALVEFIYHGEVNVHQRSLSSFLKTAEVLRVSGLTQQHGDDREQIAQVHNISTRPPQHQQQHPHQNHPSVQHPSNIPPMSMPTTNHHPNFVDKLMEDSMHFNSPTSPPHGATVNQLLRRAALHHHRRERRISADIESDHHHKRMRSDYLLNNNNSSTNNNNELNLSTTNTLHAQHHNHHQQHPPPQTQPADFSPSGVLKNSLLNLKCNNNNNNNNNNSSALDAESTGNGISSTERERSPSSCSPHITHSSSTPTGSVSHHNNNNNTNNINNNNKVEKLVMESNVKCEPLELLCPNTRPMSTDSTNDNSNDSTNGGGNVNGNVGDDGNDGPLSLVNNLPQGPHSGGSSGGGNDRDDHDSSPLGSYLSQNESKLFATAAGSFNFSMAALASDPTGLGVLLFPGLSQSFHQSNAENLAGTSQGGVSCGGSSSPVKKVFTCQLCSKVLCSKASLKRHIADKHAERQEEYRCVICERVYCSRNSLMTHIYTYHKSRPGDIDIKFF